MESVGFVASLITLIATVDGVYSLIHDIKGGPEEVEKLVSALDQLKSFVKQLREVPHETENERKRLQEAITQCDAALKRDVMEKLHKLRLAGGDSKAKKSWKYVKCFLQKKDFSNMWHCVHTHIQLLGLGLSILSR
jgi:hypothetical protein